MDSANHQTTTGDNDSSTRSNDRIGYVAILNLSTKSGNIFTGETTDVSLTGAFLYTETEPTNVVPGEPGIVEITIKEADREVSMVFPCFVARVTSTGLGLSFEVAEEDDENAETMYMVKDD
jgi:hypothetical protein